VVDQPFERKKFSMVLEVVVAKTKIDWLRYGIQYGVAFMAAPFAMQGDLHGDLANKLHNGMVLTRRT